jgi:CRISPR-associated Csx2 family protein
MTGKTLITFLGANPKDYNEVEYFLSGSEEIFKTAYIGAALIKFLKPDVLHLFGTPTSMWPTVFFDTATELQGSSYDQFLAVVKAGTLQESDALLRELEGQICQHFGVQEAYCHIIPLGVSETDWWEIFHKVASAPGQGSSVYLDITHGFRHIPLIGALAIAYFEALEAVNVSGLFYGAFEMRGQYENRVPIFDLFSCWQLFDWIYAARVFREYGDARSLAKLMESTGEETMQTSAQQLRELSQYTQLNLLRRAAGKAAQTKGELKVLSVGSFSHSPLATVMPLIGKLLDTLTKPSTSIWSVSLRMARHYWNSSQLTQAILAADEAWITRMCELFAMDDADFTYGRRPLVKMVHQAQERRPSKLLHEHLAFLDASVRIHRYRGQVAHSDSIKQQGKFSAQEVLTNFPADLSALEQTLYGNTLETLPQILDIDHFR